MRNYLFTTVLTSSQDQITVISKTSAVFYDLLMTSLQSNDQTTAHSPAGGVKPARVAKQSVIYT
jgi:hypothetical protein